VTCKVASKALVGAVLLLLLALLKMLESWSMLVLLQHKNGMIHTHTHAWHNTWCA